MNIKLIKTLISICLVLLLIIALEWLYAQHVQEEQLQSTIKPPSAPTLPDMPTINLNALIQAEESYSDLVNRPLFISGRKPIPEDAPIQAPSTGVSNTVDWQLKGIYTTKKGLMALLTRTVAKTPGDKYRKVIVGGNIDGWKVTEIHPDKIKLAQGDVQKEFLLRKPKKAKTPPQQNGAIPPNSGSDNPAMPEQLTNDPSENDNNAPAQ